MFLGATGRGLRNSARESGGYWTVFEQARFGRALCLRLAQASSGRSSLKWFLRAQEALLCVFPSALVASQALCSFSSSRHLGEAGKVPAVLT
jgi:hypothetical protein